jgi:DNA (cytosine-5)-methyltransferase 1
LKALDLFCGAGGATRGLQRAGFTVAGVDIDSQPHYIGEFFIKTDALTWQLEKGEYDFVWASPPCQKHTNAQRIQKRNHPDLIPATREKLHAAGIPFCIENVVGAPLVNPIMLCGVQFGLGTYRHRLFECSFPIAQIKHETHWRAQAKMGRPVQDGEFIQIVGNFSDVTKAREAMQIDWMTRDEMAQAIPPAYSKYIAEQWLAREKKQS